jgi:PAS domain S-box-containing protein
MSRPLRVLILEDNPKDAELAVRELRRSGFEPDWCRVDTEKDYLTNLDDDFDIILSDYAMPQFDGMRALELLKQRGLDIPFVLVSGTIGEEVAVQALRNGAADYLLKDRIARLGPAVEHALDQERSRGERKQAEGVLRASETRYRRLFETGQDGILILDPNTRKITDANPFMSKLLDYPHDELVGKELWEIGLPKDEEASRSAFRELQEKYFVRYENLPLQDKMGQRHEVEFVSNRYDEDGHKVIQCNIRSITERKRIEAELRDACQVARAAREEAERANRAKDIFLANLSHELRTPLTPVLMCAAALEQESAIEPQFRQQLGMMRRNIELEARLIDDLLDLTMAMHGKLQLLQFDPVDIHSLLTHTQQIVQGDALEKSIHFQFELKAGEHYVSGDSARLHQVFWNLFKNAIKFTPADGCIMIRTSNPAPGRIALSVADSGVGIDAPKMPFIFRAFEQGETQEAQPSGGLGLGLSISKAIVELHGGIIRAESGGPGLGATFTVEIATVIPLPTGPTRESKPPSQVDSQRFRLLVIEDHEPTMTVLARLLRRNGHDVLTAGTVQDALLLAATHSFDLVISDIGLPDGNGIDLMRQLTKDYGLRGIAMSGYGTAADRAKTKQAGFLEHLVKPIKFDQLDRVLREIVPAADVNALA